MDPNDVLNSIEMGVCYIQAARSGESARVYGPAWGWRPSPHVLSPRHNKPSYNCLLAVAAGHAVSNYKMEYERIKAMLMPEALATAIRHFDGDVGSATDLAAVQAGAQSLGVQLVILPS